MPDKIKFFGFQNRIENMSSSARIIIPKVVIDEISEDKHRSLNAKRDQLQSNPFVEILGLDMSNVADFNVNEHITQMLQNESGNFEIYEIADQESANKKIYEWAVNHVPPFEKEGDKGFKDALIVCSIEEILKDNPYEPVYLFSKDQRLADTFIKNVRVVLIREFEEMEKYLYSSFVDDYLRDRLSEELDLPQIEISDAWLNIDDNWVFKIKTGEMYILAIVDQEAREFLAKTENDYEDDIRFLLQSSSFAHTHAAVDLLSGCIKFIPISKLVQMVDASLENSQVYSVGTDDDVKEFFLPVFIKVRSYLSEDQAQKFIRYYGVKDD